MNYPPSVECYSYGNTLRRFHFSILLLRLITRESMAIQLVVYGIIQVIYGVVFCLSLVWVLFVLGALTLFMLDDGATKALKAAKDLYHERWALAVCLPSLATFGASSLFPLTLAVVCTSLATSLGMIPLLLAVDWPPDKVEFVWLCAGLATPFGIMLLWAYQHPDAVWTPLVILLSLVMKVLAPFWPLLMFPFRVLAPFWALLMFPFRVLAAIWTFVTFPIRVLAAFEAFGQGLILAVFEATFRVPAAIFTVIRQSLIALWALAAFRILAAFLSSTVFLVAIIFVHRLIRREIRLQQWHARKAEQRLVSNCPVNPRSTSITTQCCNTHNARGQGGQAAIVLSEFEADFPCGSFTVGELLFELKDTFCCDPLNDRFYLTWLEYFIKRDSPFGFVYAWAKAVMAHHDSPNPEYLDWKPEKLDVSLTCLAHDDRARFISKKKDQEFICNASDSANPRRVWDIASNKVIPGSWVRRSFAGEVRIWAISHAWAPPEDREYIWTSVNSYQWPVPIPKGVKLEKLREDLIGLGCRYAWLDVLCLRQEYRKELTKIQHLLGERKRRERLRLKEWKIDVPTIGFIYCAPSPVVIYFNHLGRTFDPTNWNVDDTYHWLKRAWTLQEAVDLDRISIGGRKDPKTPTEDLLNMEASYTN
ncbi:hypothetical protein BDZ91DRAFT_820980 [Kalaharituber pfeilii]|nr:hypothetical protein BDZ91DRAFT_820980 [Kalaharituber pfeilii]